MAKWWSLDTSCSPGCKSSHSSLNGDNIYAKSFQWGKRCSHGHPSHILLYWSKMQPPSFNGSKPCRNPPLKLPVGMKCPWQHCHSAALCHFALYPHSADSLGYQISLGGEEVIDYRDADYICIFAKSLVGIKMYWLIFFEDVMCQSKPILNHSGLLK